MNAHAYSVNDAQADRCKLAALLNQTIDAMPQDSDPSQYRDIAQVLIAETLASAKRQGLLPVSQQVHTLAGCRKALGALPSFPALTAFQAAAQAALRRTVMPEP